jgi:excisionase family DNA binding protein
MNVPEGYEHLLTIAEAAEFLGTTERFPRRLVEQRRVEFIKVGRAVRFRQQALVEYLARQTVMPTEYQRLRTA